MKKVIFILASLFCLSISTQAQWKAASFEYVAINAKDTVVSGDTIYLKPGANIVAPYADSLAALKFYLPAGETIHDGAIYHITCTKKIVTITYLHGTTQSLPTAFEITEPVTKTGLNGKNICVGGAFSIIYRSKRDTWYRYQ